MESTKIILKGQAGKQIDPRSVIISGAITSVVNYLDALKGDRLGNFDTKSSAIRVSDRSIEFIGNYHLDINHTIIGSLNVSEVITTLGINTDKMYLSKELEKVLRFKRYLFASDAEWSETIARLQKINIKTSGSVNQESTNNRKAVSVEKEHDFKPISFNLSVDLFKQKTKSVFPVTIYADITDVGAKLWLESIDLPNLIEEISGKLIQEQVNKLKEFPFPIIYI